MPAQLVAYSGWSNANYLREPFSADLDFGVGEWNASAWVNNSGFAPHNALSFPEDFTNAVWTAGIYSQSTANVTVTPTAGASPFGDNTASKLVLNSGQVGDPNTAKLFRSLSYVGNSSPAGYAGPWTTSIYVKAAGIDVVRLYHGNSAGSPEPGIATGIQYTFSTDTLVSYSGNTGSNRIVSRELLSDGWVRLVLQRPTGDQTAGTGGLWVTFNSTVTGDGTSGVLIFGAAMNRGTTAFPYRKGLTAAWESVAPVVDRAHSSGPRIQLCVNHLGYLTATAFDGTTTRTVTTTAAYNTATWLKAEAQYTTDGTLSILVNGVEVAATRGAPLLTLNNSNAVLTIGNSFAADAPFPGSIALLKLSATAPTAEQATWMYEQEKQMFREGAQVTLPDSGAIADLAYDDLTDKWIAVSAANESEWSGLVRTSVTPTPAGSYSKVSAASGVQLLARTTTNPGVDISAPAQNLREELIKRGEAAARMNAQLATFDYVGGFTATTTTGSTAITSVASLTYPVSYVGARVTGTGIPADTFVAGVVGTTVYLTKPATASASAVQISFTDFILPTGMEAKEVSLAGVAQREGATAQFTRLFDGFKETIRFGTAPSNTALIQIQAARSAA